MRIISTFVVACSLALPAMAQSPASAPSPDVQQEQRFSYSFVQAEVFRTDIDDFDEDADGFELDIAYGFNEHFYVIAGFATQSVDTVLGDLDVDTIGVGLGFHTPVGPQTDVVAQLSFLHSEAELAGVEDDDDGFSAEVGVRHWLAEKFEVDANIAFVDVGDDDDTGFGLGARFYATPVVSIGAGIDVFDDTQTIGLGVRFQF